MESRRISHEGERVRKSAFQTQPVSQKYHQSLSQLDRPVYRSVSHSRLSVSQYRPVCWLVAQPVSQSVMNALGHYISQSFILSSNKSDKQSISQSVPLTVSQPVNEQIRRVVSVSSKRSDILNCELQYSLNQLANAKQFNGLSFSRPVFIYFVNLAVGESFSQFSQALT